jgi:hypothetical protein
MDMTPVLETVVTAVPPLTVPGRQSAPFEQLQPPAYTLFRTFIPPSDANSVLGQLRTRLIGLPDVVVLQWANVADQTQAWFWTAPWQSGEREASDDIARANLTHYGNNIDFLNSIDQG